jgi:hypothetical protein
VTAICCAPHNCPQSNLACTTMSEMQLLLLIRSSHCLRMQHVKSVRRRLNDSEHPEPTRRRIRGWRRFRRSGRQSQAANRPCDRPYGQRRRRQSQGASRTCDQRSRGWSQGASRTCDQRSRSWSQRAASACLRRHHRTWRQRTRRCFCFFGVHSDWIFVRADQLSRGYPTHVLGLAGRCSGIPS